MIHPRKEQLLLVISIFLDHPKFSLSHWKCCFTNAFTSQMLSHCKYCIGNVASPIALQIRNALKTNFFLQVEKLNNLWQQIIDLVLNDFLAFTDTQIFGHPFELFVKFRILYRFHLKTLKLAFHSGHRLVRVCDAFLE